MCWLVISAHFDGLANLYICPKDTKLYKWNCLKVRYPLDLNGAPQNLGVDDWLSRSPSFEEPEMSPVCALALAAVALEEASAASWGAAPQVTCGHCC